MTVKVDIEEYLIPKIEKILSENKDDEMGNDGAKVVSELIKLFKDTYLMGIEKDTKDSLVASPYISGTWSELARRDTINNPIVWTSDSLTARNTSTNSPTITSDSVTNS